MKNQMKHIGLFEGIGGFSLAAEWMGWETIAWCEWNEFGQTILNEKYPNAKQHGNIRTTDFTVYRGQCDILTGGFPCQPYSVAGKRKGKEDDRHLWPEMLRAIREIQPRWIVGENVFGLINWSNGLVFHEVQSDLETEGYEVFPFVLPACGVNAPHRRDRVWFVAYSGGKSREQGINGREECFSKRNKIRYNDFTDGEIRFTPNANYNGSHGTENRQSNSQGNDSNETRQNTTEQLTGCSSEAAGKITSYPNSGQRCEGRLHTTECEKTERYTSPCDARSNEPNWQNFPTQSPVCDGNDGFSTESLRQRIREDCLGVISEKEINKIISAAASRWRKETIMAGGNAIVPQVVFQIYKAIEQYERSIQ